LTEAAGQIRDGAMMGNVDRETLKDITVLKGSTAQEKMAQHK
jgi:hypothetical protein